MSNEEDTGAAASAALRIRRITAADQRAWWPLWRGYQQFYRVQIADDVSERTWQRLLADDEPMHAALAWQGGVAVGLVHWIFHRSCWTAGDYCYLQDLFVAPQRRGEGIGGQLIEHVGADAARAGCSRVWWLTHETNHDAMRLYDRVAERSGFVQYRRPPVR